MHGSEKCANLNENRVKKVAYKNFEHNVSFFINMMDL